MPRIDVLSEIPATAIDDAARASMNTYEGAGQAHHKDLSRARLALHDATRTRDEALSARRAARQRRADLEARIDRQRTAADEAAEILETRRKDLAEVLAAGEAARASLGALRVRVEAAEAAARDHDSDHPTELSDTVALTEEIRAWAENFTAMERLASPEYVRVHGAEIEARNALADAEARLRVSVREAEMLGPVIEALEQDHDRRLSEVAETARALAAVDDELESVRLKLERAGETLAAAEAGLKAAFTRLELTRSGATAPTDLLAPFVRLASDMVAALDEPPLAGPMPERARALLEPLRRQALGMVQDVASLEGEARRGDLGYLFGKVVDARARLNVLLGELKRFADTVVPQIRQEDREAMTARIAAELRAHRTATFETETAKTALAPEKVRKPTDVRIGRIAATLDDESPDSLAAARQQIDDLIERAIEIAEEKREQEILYARKNDYLKNNTSDLMAYQRSLNLSKPVIFAELREMLTDVSVLFETFRDRIDKYVNTHKHAKRIAADVERGYALTHAQWVAVLGLPADKTFTTMRQDTYTGTAMPDRTGQRYELHLSVRNNCLKEMPEAIRLVGNVKASDIFEELFVTGPDFFRRVHATFCWENEKFEPDKHAAVDTLKQKKRRTLIPADIRDAVLDDLERYIDDFIAQKKPLVSEQVARAKQKLASSNK